MAFVTVGSQQGVPIQLYVKVIEARGIKGVEKNGNSDPMVELWVNNDKKHCVKTKAFENTLTPQWNEEYVFSLNSSHTTITLNVVDWNRILKNEPLGKATIEAWRVTPGPGIDMWLPINTQGEIRVFVQATTLAWSPNGHSVKQLDRFRMVLERLEFYPGEVVRGAIMFNVGPPKKIRGVRVRLTGQSRTHFNMRSNPEAERLTSGGRMRAHVYYFDPIATLFGNPKGHGQPPVIIESGAYYWPFEFPLPINMAPTYHHLFGDNETLVKGYVDIPWARDKVIHTELIVRIQYNQLHPTSNERFSDKAKALFAANQNITVGLKAPELAYTGESVAVEVSIENQGTKEVKEVIVELISELFFSGRGNSYGPWHTRVVKTVLGVHKIKGVAGFPVPPGQRWNGTIQVPIPAGLDPSVPEGISPIIQVIYSIKATMNTSGNLFTKASNHKHLPILVSERRADAPHVLISTGQVVAAVPTITLAQVAAPAEVLQYMAPAAPPTNVETISAMGTVISHEAFVAANPFQPEQWVLHDEEGAVEYDPNMMANVETTIEIND